MGTRNLTAVFANRRYCVAQYGQWDGYPEGQGSTVYAFCKRRGALAKLMDREPQLQWATKEQVEGCWKSVGSRNGMVTLEQSEEFRAKFAHLSRDTGAGILNEVVRYRGKEPMLLQNSIAFAGDSLFCEWAYVLDLDKGWLEVYLGFNKDGMPRKGERFHPTRFKREARASLEPSSRSERYYPVRMLCRFWIGSAVGLPRPKGLKKTERLPGTAKAFYKAVHEARQVLQGPDEEE